MNNAARIKAVREAGAVERSHVVPHIRSYNNAAHSWGVACICRILWPEDRHLVDFAMFHDIPERWTGDIPGQIKHQLGAGVDILTSMDRDIMSQLQLPCEHDLSEEDLQKLRAADWLELWLWTWEEEAMGNTQVLGVRDNLDNMFANAHWLPDEVWEVIDFIDANGWKRNKENWA